VLRDAGWRRAKLCDDWGGVAQTSFGDVCESNSSFTDAPSLRRVKILSRLRFADRRH
jgi:hypothetical protein